MYQYLKPDSLGFRAWSYYLKSYKLLPNPIFYASLWCWLYQCSCLNLTQLSVFQLCKKHHFGIDKPEKVAQSPDESKFLMKTFSQIKSNVAVPIKKKVFLSLIDFTKIYLQNHTLPFSIFPTFKGFKVLAGFSFLCFVILLLFSIHPPTPVFPCLPGQGKQREGATGEAAAGWAVQDIHGLRLLLLQHDLRPDKQRAASGRLREDRPTPMETGLENKQDDGTHRYIVLVLNVREGRCVFQLQAAVSI